jgi:hypothetical protein
MTARKATAKRSAGTTERLRSSRRQQIGEPELETLLDRIERRADEVEADIDRLLASLRARRVNGEKSAGGRPVWTRND